MVAADFCRGSHRTLRTMWRERLKYVPQFAHEGFPDFPTTQPFSWLRELARRSSVLSEVRIARSSLPLQFLVLNEHGGLSCKARVARKVNS